MGAGLSNPIDGEKQQAIEKSISDVLVPFGKAYPKQYVLALFNKIKAEKLEALKGGDSGDSYQLEAPADAEPSTEPLMTGYLTKEGAIRKSWKKRFFVVRPDYKIEYYEKEEVFKAQGKPKGIISPAGYSVVTDLENDMRQKAEKLAEMLKVDISDVPKPKSYPEFTFGVTHERRRGYFIQAENKAEMDEWVAMFKTCCRKAEGLNDNEEVAKEAYTNAFTATREANGYGNWFDGTEVDNLSDLIMRNIHYNVLLDVFAKLEAPVKLRSTLKNKIEEGVGSAVGTAVKAAWSAAESGVKASRATLEDKINKNSDPIIEADKKVTDSITEKVSAKVDPAIAKHVTPKLSKVLPILLKPLTAAFEQSFKVYDEISSKAKEDLDKKEDQGSVFRSLSRSATSSKVLKPCFEQVDKIAEGLAKVEDIPMLAKAESIASVLSAGKSAIEQLMSMAAYTTKKRTDSKVAEGAEPGAAATDARSFVSGALRHDARLKIAETVKDMLMGFIKPPVDEEVLAPCKEAIAPVSDTIPDLAKDFISPEDKLDEVVETIIGNALNSAIDPVLPEFK
eukprot:m.128884 g.128884  ORF g.128884 m.128884 type:complete len:564 (+) comp19914_c0_seq1:86-1777(+)